MKESGSCPTGLQERNDMTDKKVIYIDALFPDLDIENSILKPEGIELTGNNCKTIQEVIDAVGDARAIINTSFKPVGEEVFSACPSVEFIIRTGIGYDTIDVKAATAHGVRVCNVPDFCIEEVSDHTAGLLLNLARSIQIVNSHMKQGKFAESGYMKIPTRRLQGSTVGIMGFGRIGRSVAEKLSAFKVNLLFYDPYVDKEEINGARKSSLEGILKESDYLCLHLPENKETHHLLNKERLGLMKPSSFIINCARGEIIDTGALVEFLQDGKLAGAALDVVEDQPSLCPDSPLCGMDNVILTPHTAWFSRDSILDLRTRVAQEVVRFFNNEKLVNLVNPEVLENR